MNPSEEQIMIDDVGKMILRFELPGKWHRGRSKKRFLDKGKTCGLIIEVVGVIEKETRQR